MNRGLLRYIYQTAGVCPPEIHFQIVDGNITGLRFVGGGCPGNAQLVGRLLENTSVAQAIARLRGIPCRNGTSCPDQLAEALEAIELGRLTPAEPFRIHQDATVRHTVAVVGELGGHLSRLEQIIALARQQGAEAVVCLGNIWGHEGHGLTTLKVLRQPEVTAILGATDWEWAMRPLPADSSPAELRQQDRLIQLPQVCQFQLAQWRAVAFYGDYLLDLPGVSDFDPFALEMNMVCGLTNFMQDTDVFPALEAMTPQFQSDIILFSQPGVWGQWQVGGKSFLSVGSAWDGRQLAWGMLAVGGAGVTFTPVYHAVTGDAVTR